MSIVLVMLLANSVFAWTAHPIRAGQDGGNSWRLTTISQDLPFGFNLPFTLATRKNGKWNMLARLVDEETSRNVKGVVDVLDKIVPAEEIISLCYYAFINEVVIYLHPERWKDKEFHEDIARKFNKLRKGVIK